MVLDTKIGPVHPTHNKRPHSEGILSNASLHRNVSCSFQYMYAREDLVPAPSACITTQCSSLPVKWSGTILQNALGKALNAFDGGMHSLPADTPRAAYLASLTVYSPGL